MEESNHPSLVFNQSSLQDYLDCHRRFELSFVKDTFWPAPTSSPLSKIEKLIALGNDFHQICQQFFIGIDPDTITSSIIDQDLLEMWDSFLPYGKTLLSYPLFAEQTLRIPIGNHFLVGKFDLIAQLSDNNYLIIDWKTTSKKPSRSDLSDRMQTHLYPYIFQQAGNDLFPPNHPLPDSIKLQYWFPRASSPEEIFPYSQTKHDEISVTITELISQIQDKIQSGSAFHLTDNLEHCKFCTFRSYCDRGNQSSSLPEGFDLNSEDLANAHFDLDMINEIEF